MRKIVLIGGAPTAGKSSLARLLSEQLKLPWISTDGIREAMRKLVRKEDYPELFHLEDDDTAEKYLRSHSAQEIVDDQNKESWDVWKGVQAFLETDYVWKDFIVEGVAVVPTLVKSLKLEGTDMFPIFLVEKNEDRIRDIVYKRGLWDDAETYSDEVKPKEVAWAKLFNDQLESEARKLGFKPFVIETPEKTFGVIIQMVRNWL